MITVVALSAFKAFVSVFGIWGGIKENFCLLLFYIGEKVVFSLVFLTIIIWSHFWKLMFIPILSAVCFVIDLYYIKELYLQKKQNKFKLNKINCKERVNNSINVNVVEMRDF